MASKKDGKDSPAEAAGEQAAEEQAAEEQAAEEQAAEPSANAAQIHGLFSSALTDILTSILDRLDKAGI